MALEKCNACGIKERKPKFVFSGNQSKLTPDV
jgi:hypothetical protein